MRRWLAVTCLLALFLLPEGRGTDIGSLKPVEVLVISIEEGRICVETDTGDRGAGMTLTSALKDMRDAASGEIFLETVSYVLVTEDTRLLLEKLGYILRPGTEAVLVTGRVDLQQVAEYLTIHRPEYSLQNYMNEPERLPKLMTAGERCYLVQSGNE